MKCTSRSAIEATGWRNRWRRRAAQRRPGRPNDPGGGISERPWEVERPNRPVPATACCSLEPSSSTRRCQRRSGSDLSVHRAANAAPRRVRMEAWRCGASPSHGRERCRNNLIAGGLLMEANAPSGQRSRPGPSWARSEAPSGPGLRGLGRAHAAVAACVRTRPHPVIRPSTLGEGIRVSRVGTIFQSAGRNAMFPPDGFADGAAALGR